MRVEQIPKLTPEDAEKLFDNRDETRPLSMRRATAMAHALETEGWIEDGEPFRFDKHGHMRDGQHRAKAIALSGITATNVVFIHDLAEGADLVMDSGQTRSFAQLLRMKGIPNVVVAGSATRLLANIDSGNWATNMWRQNYQTNVSLWNYYRKHADEIQDGIKLATPVVRQVPIIPSVLSAVAVLALRIDEDDANDFFEQLSLKAEPEPTVRRLQRWANNQEERNNRTGSVAQRIQMGVTVKTWNRWRVRDDSGEVLRFHRNDKWQDME